MSVDPTQIVTLALAVVGAIGTAAKVAEKIAPKWIKLVQGRESVSDDHARGRINCEQRVADLRAELAEVRTKHDHDIARLLERVVESERQRGEDIERLTRELSRANARLEHQADEIRALRDRNLELTRKLQEVNARTESSPPTTRIG